jgi:disulfide bond formation protein DsbB
MAALDQVATALAILALVANVLVAAAILGFLLGLVSPPVRVVWDGARDLLTPYAFPGALVVAVIATLGSLYFQFGAGLQPCELCWFQRVCMYPQTVVLTVSLARRDLRGARLYAFPLALVGMGLSAYHYQLERIPTEPTPSCGIGQPVCSQSAFDIFGFISIPYLALSAFLLITTLLLMAREPQEEWEEEPTVSLEREEPVVVAGPRRS